MKRIALLGATGSIGTSTIDVANLHRDKLSITAVAAKSNAVALASIARSVNAKIAVLSDSSKYNELKAALSGTGIIAACGDDAITELCSRDDVDVVLNALVGAAGVVPTLTALTEKKPVALANKETLVCAGSLVAKVQEQTGTPILPVDSEHSALFQCLTGEPRPSIRRLILTASGGPFRETPLETLRTVKPEQALKHPTWKMGSKVTIDSSTLVNKGLELIEARWLFDVGEDKLDVWIHPQSIVHSLVEFEDRSMKAQLSNPDMRIPIQYALSYPQRWKSDWVPNDVVDFTALNFFVPDWERFPAPQLALAALRGSSGMAAVFNASDEIAVPAFLAGQISYLGITSAIRDALTQFDGRTVDSVQELLVLDQEVRVEVTAAIESGKYAA